MAVTLTRGQLAVAIRLATAETDTLQTGQAAVLDRLLAVATAAVEKYAETAPAEVQNEAAIRFAAWLFDTDPSEVRRTASPLIASGAASLLASYRTHRLVGVAET